MTDVAGASRYLSASTLANVQGISPYTASLLDGGTGAQSLLDSGRRINRSGVGISASSRALADQFIGGNASKYNQLLSLGVGAGLTVEGLKTQINGLRASLPDSAIAESLRGKTIDEQA
ncbi:MAG: hypothetical protein ACT4OY_05500 [Alphaproteobacteria bacterium]